MKAAKEIINKIGFYKMTGSHLMISEDEVMAAMKEYAAEACKEQREMCVNSYLNGGHDFVEDAILNAPQPQLV